MKLFEIIKTIFTDSSKYSSISKGEKQKYFFVLNRRFAIQYPLQANALQNLKINQSIVIDFWQYFLTKNHKFMPGWIYTKGIKKSQEVKENKLAISNAIINEYSKYFKIDRKSILDALKFYESDMISELKKFENILKQK